MSIEPLSQPESKIPVETNPSLTKKAVSFLTAEVVWLSHGRPFRNVHDINHIYYRICRECEHFENNGCCVCGCRIVPHERSPLNKLSMATTNCPLPDPKWVSDITPPESMTPEHYQAVRENSKAVLQEVNAPDPSQQVPFPLPTIPQSLLDGKKKEGAAVTAETFVRTTTGQIVQGDGL